MSAQAEDSVREFFLDGTLLVDLDDEATEEGIKKMYASQYPKLVNAKIEKLDAGPNGERRFKFVVPSGNKG